MRLRLRPRFVVEKCLCIWCDVYCGRYDCIGICGGMERWLLWKGNLHTLVSKNHLQVFQKTRTTNDEIVVVFTPSVILFLPSRPTLYRIPPCTIPPLYSPPMPSKQISPSPTSLLTTSSQSQISQSLHASPLSSPSPSPLMIPAKPIISLTKNLYERSSSSPAL